MRNSAADGTSVISGTAYEDLNRNGVPDFGKQPMAGEGSYLRAKTGSASSATPPPTASAATPVRERFSAGFLAVAP